jgi:hypothetical protein
MISLISSFNSIPIAKNTLVLCDIDDTVLYYPECNKKCIEIVKNGPFRLTKDAYLKDFRDACNTYKMVNPPSHTDYDGFKNMVYKLNKYDGKLLFLTSRSKMGHEYTKKQLQSIGIECNDDSIHYTDNIITKGDYIKKHILISEWSEVIFIDDILFNIQTVNAIVPQIKCFQFVPALVSAI